MGCSYHIETYNVRDPRAEFYWAEEEKMMEVKERVYHHMCKYWDKKIMEIYDAHYMRTKRENPIPNLFPEKENVSWGILNRLS